MTLTNGKPGLFGCRVQVQVELEVCVQRAVPLAPVACFTLLRCFRQLLPPPSWPSSSLRRVSIFDCEAQLYLSAVISIVLNIHHHSGLSQPFPPSTAPPISTSFPSLTTTTTLAARVVNRALTSHPRTSTPSRITPHPRTLFSVK